MEMPKGDRMTDIQAKIESTPPDDSLNLAELIPEHFARFFELFRPGHQEGIVPSRIKELARLKIAALNQCDT
jgi:hypothetical protein